MARDDGRGGMMKIMSFVAVGASKAQESMRIEQSRTHAEQKKRHQGCFCSEGLTGIVGYRSWDSHCEEYFRTRGTGTTIHF